MMDFLLRLFDKVQIRAERATLGAQLRRLNKAGHAFSKSAHYGPRLEIHAAPGSRIIIGDGVEVLNDTWLIAHPGNTLSLGKNVFVSQHCTISGDVSVGDDTLIAGFVSIIDANHIFNRSDIPIREQGGGNNPIVIGKDVWIGTHCVILQGVTIGDHCVIGANSTVTSDLPEWSIAAGNPARIISIRERPE